MTTSENPQALAEATANSMYARDHATQALGIKIMAIKPGLASMQMVVQKTMLNGHQTCHGGYIFTLADSAFAFACNSYNIQAVAAGCSIEYLAPAYEHDVLTAQAQEQSRTGRTGIYDVAVMNQDDKKIALFRGKSHQLKDVVIQK
jgi:acyl-CoA thioesterase